MRGSEVSRLTRYRCPVSSPRVPGGVVHKLPGDLREALIANATALDAWKDITLWPATSSSAGVEDAKQETTRSAAFAGPGRSWRKASVGPVAGRGASTASARADRSRVTEPAPAFGMIAIEEDQGMGGAAYSIRNIQSSKKITVAATGKDPATGKMKTEGVHHYLVKGPVAVMVTTTAAELEGETASRFLFLTIDESSKMTAAIHRKQREADTLEGLMNRTRANRDKGSTTPPKAAQAPCRGQSVYKVSLLPRRVFKPPQRPQEVPGPHPDNRISFPVSAGDKKAAVEGKEVEYIEVTLDDIDKANHLAHQVLGQCLDELAPPSRTLLTLIYNMVKAETDKTNEPIDQYSFNRRHIRERTGWTDWQIKAHIKQLEEMEYLHVRVGAQGKQYSYALNYKGEGIDGGRCYLNLTPVCEIKRLADLEGKTGG